MAQRRTPGGQGPSGRVGPAGRSRSGGREPVTSGRREPVTSGRREPVTSGRREPTGRREPSARPASARRPAATGGAKRTSAPEPRRLTGRAAILTLVLVGLLLAYAYPIRVYLSQQAEIAQLELEQTVQRQHIADLAEERAKWDDPEYVKAQARKRFQLVERGERTYIVIFDPVGAARDAGVDPAAADRQDDPWYGKLWSSIGEANK
jgi:cell division protein FtsB